MLVTRSVCNKSLLAITNNESSLKTGTLIKSITRVSIHNENLSDIRSFRGWAAAVSYSNGI